MYSNNILDLILWECVKFNPVRYQIWWYYYHGKRGLEWLFIVCYSRSFLLLFIRFFISLPKIFHSIYIKVYTSCLCFIHWVMPVNECSKFCHVNSNLLYSPYIIGTMNQATCSTTNLQLHHNFRWVLCANHMEPVKGFLGRYLRRKLVEAEVRTGIRNNDLNRIIDWVPKVWLHLNKFLETHSSSDVTIGIEHHNDLLDFRKTEMSPIFKS